MVQKFILSDSKPLFKSFLLNINNMQKIHSSWFVKSSSVCVCEIHGVREEIQLKLVREILYLELLEKINIYHKLTFHA